MGGALTDLVVVVDFVRYTGGTEPPASAVNTVANIQIFELLYISRLLSIVIHVLPLV